MSEPFRVLGSDQPDSSGLVRTNRRGLRCGCNRNLQPCLQTRHGSSKIFGDRDLVHNPDCDKAWRIAKQFFKTQKDHAKIDNDGNNDQCIQMTELK